MQRLQSILHHMIEQFQLILLSPYDPEHLIHHVDVLTPSTQPDTHTLYLIDSQSADPVSSDSLVPDLRSADPAFSDSVAMDGHAANPAFSDSAMPEAARVSATASSSVPSTGLSTDPSLPAFYAVGVIPAAPPFIGLRLRRMPDAAILCECLNRFILQEDQLSHQIQLLYQCLGGSVGIQGIIRRAARFLNPTVTLCDASYNFLAADTLLANHLPDHDIQSMKRNHVIDKLYRNTGAFSFISPDYPDIHWLFCAIRIQQVMVGFIVVKMIKTPPDSLQLRYAASLAEILSIEMQRSSAARVKTSQSYEDFLINLLDGKYRDEAFIRTRITLFDRKFYRHFCVLYFTGIRQHDRQIFHKYQLDSLRQHYVNSISVVYKDAIVLLLTQEEPIDFTQAFLAPFEEFASLNSVTIAFSQPFCDITLTHDYCRQAMAVSTMAKSRLSDYKVLIASQLLPQLLMSNTPVDDLKSGIHYRLESLEAYDRLHHTQLLETLKAYLECDRNATKTAEYLNIHRSSLFYRIKKLEEVLGTPISDSRQMFLYELSFKTREYIEHFL